MLYMNANIIRSNFFPKIKYDFKGDIDGHIKSPKIMLKIQLFQQFLLLLKYLIQTLYE